LRTFHAVVICRYWRSGLTAVENGQITRSHFGSGEVVRSATCVPVPRGARFLCDMLSDLLETSRKNRFSPDGGNLCAGVS
jgi:hypothetical protein